MQTRVQSAVETAIGTGVGYVVAVAANAAVLPLFGFQPSFGESNAIAVIFTAISLLRGYAVRRFFNWWHHRR